jgi:5'-methylthioadenosine phosphorylase
MSELRAAVGVIGGTGFYQLLDNAEAVTVQTPYGTVSDRVRLGVIGETAVAFLPRHGSDHSVPPHRINYRANVWALHSLGVRQIVAPCAVGSLNRDLGPGAIVLPDQLVDRTTGREQTYFEEGGNHIPFADPYCDHGRRVVAGAAAAIGEDVHDGGTMVVIDGPRFSTRAESRYYTRQGWDLINMTGHPEAVLARELGICYNALALVTDYDAGVDAAESVNQDAVYEMFGKNLGRLRSLVLGAVTGLTPVADCVCVTTRGNLPLPAGTS